MTETPKPPPKPSVVPEWATEVPTRSPVFKTHATLGQARQAIACHGWINTYRVADRDGVILWHWNGTEWELAHEVKKGDLKADLPWRKKK